METETAEIIIDRPEDAVWAVAGDFGGVAWMPGIDAVTVDGDVRSISMNGMDIKERLVKKDDEAHELTYTIFEIPVPIEDHQATISTTPAGDGTSVTWSVTAGPDGTAGFLKTVYQGALEALKAKLEAEG